LKEILEVVGRVDFEKGNGLIPVVVQDFETNEVLMLAYMNRKALIKTLRTGFAHYWSRSRNKMWFKGSTSSNFQEVKEVILDCDSDAVLLKVRQYGPACHTGERSCFHNIVHKFD